MITFLWMNWIECNVLFLIHINQLMINTSNYWLIYWLILINTGYYVLISIIIDEYSWNCCAAHRPAQHRNFVRIRRCQTQAAPGAEHGRRPVAARHELGDGRQQQQRTRADHFPQIATGRGHQSSGSSAGGPAARNAALCPTLRR